GLFVAVVRNITKRKLAEKELRRQKNLMWQVIDMDPNMIFVKDKQGRFILANRAIADYYGVAIQKMIGRKNSDFNPNPQEVEGFHASDHEVIKSMHELVLTEMLMKNGEQYWYHTVKRPLSQDDGSLNVLGIAADVTELKLSENKLAESYKELQRLALYLENVRAEERAQIARNLHDEMGATLAALKMRIAWLKSKLPEGMPQLAAEIDHMSDLVSAGILTVRQVVTDLRPDLLEDVGLAAAVKDYVKRFQRDTEIECTLVLQEEDVHLNVEQSVTVFRIIQESLNNVAKHAQASRVEINFARQGDLLELQISDNGIGFDPTSKERSFGLLGIKERALMIGGTATIASTPGKGSQVSLSIPLSP
ncbi:MAG: PAS domain-containing protein, partial [Gallionella sp.]